VIEADEYDRSFLRLSPDIAVVSAMDPDHLDIYGTEKALEDAFIEFGSKVKKGGLLLSKLTSWLGSVALLLGGDCVGLRIRSWHQYYLLAS